MKTVWSFVKIGCVGAICALNGACSLAIPYSYVDPQEVTLPQAMADVACGLKTLQNEYARLDLNTGQLVDEIDVTFNVKASATGNSTLVVDAKPAMPPTLLSSLGLSYTDKTELAGERGNQVKVTLRNVYTASLNKPGQSVVKKANYGLGMGSRLYYPQQNPCSPIELSPQDVKHAVKINDPVIRR